MRELIEAEFRAVPNYDFIALAFRRTLGREPTPQEAEHCEKLGVDADGIAGRWRLLNEISKFASAPGNLVNFRSEICDASAFLKLENPKFVETVCRALLLREPDTGEQERHLTALENGTLSKRQIIEQLLGSAEFRSLQRPLRVIWGSGSPSSEAAPVTAGETKSAAGDLGGHLHG